MSVILSDNDVQGSSHRESMGNPLGESASQSRLPDHETVSDLVGFFKLLSDETRLKILFILNATGETNVLELCQELDQRQPAVSHHLALLRMAGLITMRRQGKNNFYRIQFDRFQSVMDTVRAISPLPEGHES